LMLRDVVESNAQRRFVEEALMAASFASRTRTGRKWIPPGKNVLIKDAQALQTSFGAWNMMTPLSSWASPLQSSSSQKTVPSGSVDAIVTRLMQPHRAPPKAPLIRVHSTQLPERITMTSSQNRRAAQSKHRPPSPLATAWRSAPTLGGGSSGSAHHRSAPSLPSRKLPDGATSKLLPDHMRQELIEYARSQDKELVLLIEMRPVQTQTLHQREDQYRHFATVLAAEMGAHLFSTRLPEFAVFSAVTVQLPSDAFISQRGIADAGGFASSAGGVGAAAGTRGVGVGGLGAAAAADDEAAAYRNPAFDDFRAAAGFVASNCSTSHAPPLRFGAFEVYLVAKLPKFEHASRPREESFHVELLFSKLFSRCWPKISNVMKRIRQHPGVMMETRRREDAFIFEQARQAGEADGPHGVRTALEQITEPLTSVVHEFGSLRSNRIIDEASKLLAGLDAGDAALHAAIATTSIPKLDEALAVHGREEGVTASRSVVHEALRQRAKWAALGGAVEPGLSGTVDTATPQAGGGDGGDTSSGDEASPRFNPVGHTPVEAPIAASLGDAHGLRRGASAPGSLLAPKRTVTWRAEREGTAGSDDVGEGRAPLALMPEQAVLADEDDACDALP